jgi:hypothetical protein
VACERAAVRTVEVNGVRLGYREYGDPDDPPVLLLHGSGSNADTWERVAARLTAGRRRSIAVDLRGHASSDRTRDYALASIRDDVVHLLDALALSDVVLVGHSVGGYAALEERHQLGAEHLRREAVHPVADRDRREARVPDRVGHLSESLRRDAAGRATRQDQRGQPAGAVWAMTDR